MRRMERLRFVAAVALICSYFLLLVWPSLDAYFTRDDLMNLHRSWSLPLTELLKANVFFFWASPFYRPLPSLWYRLMLHVAGFHPFPFHLVYLAIFLANIWLTYCVARYLSDSREVATVAALLGSYHSSMNVLYFDTAYIFDVLCYFFFSSAFLLYVRVRQQRRRLAIWELSACCVLLILALNSKEMALTLPLFLFSYEWLYHPPPSRLHLRSWVIRHCGGAVVTGAIALAFVVGRATGEASLLSIPAYRPVFTWARFMQTNSHYLGDLFGGGGQWPRLAVLAIWALLLVTAWKSKSRTLQFAGLFLNLSVLPVAFVEPRGAAQYYIPWFGWVLYGSTVLMKGVQWLTPRLPAEKTWIRAGVVLVVLSTVLCPYYRRRGWANVTSVAVEAPIDRAVAEQFHRLEPRFRTGSRLFFFADGPLPIPWVDLFFLLRLSYGDASLELERPQDLKHQPDEQELGSYDHVFDYQRGQFLELARPWHRAESHSRIPMIVLNPNGPELYHEGWVPVTPESAATPGEVLIAKAVGLGATEPPLAPGMPFPAAPLLRVTTTLTVTIDGHPARVVNQIGWPEMVSTYRLDFVVPTGTHSGVAEVQIAANGMTGPAVEIPVR